MAHFAGGERTRGSRRPELVEWPQPGCGEAETDSPPVFARSYKYATLRFDGLIAN